MISGWRCSRAAARRRPGAARLFAWFVGFEQATTALAALGRLLAVGMGLLAGHPLLPFIAVFLFFAAGAEARDASMTRVLEEIRAADAVNP